jgi:uncharacterized protein (DUF3820 family)
MPFGRFKNRHIEEIPTDYLRWLYRRVPTAPRRGCMGCKGPGMTQELHLYIEEELKRRKVITP